MQLHVLDDHKLRIHDDDNEANSLTSASQVCGIKVCHARTHTLQVSAISSHHSHYLAGFQLLH